MKKKKEKNRILKNLQFYDREGLDTPSKIQNRHKVLRASDGKIYATDQRGWRLVGQSIH